MEEAIGGPPLPPAARRRRRPRRRRRCRCCCCCWPVAISLACIGGRRRRSCHSAACTISAANILANSRHFDGHNFTGRCCRCCWPVAEVAVVVGLLLLLCENFSDGPAAAATARPSWCEVDESPAAAAKVTASPSLPTIDEGKVPAAASACRLSVGSNRYLKRNLM